MVTRSSLLSTVRGLSREMMLILVWCAAAVVCVAVLFAGSHTSASRALTASGLDAGGELSVVTGRLGESARFSDVVQIPGTDSVVVVGDDGDEPLFVWRLGEYGAVDAQPTGVALPAGTRLEDGEGITTDGKFIYVIGSHSLTQDGASRHNVLLRLRWDGDHLVFAGAITDLQARLEAAFPPVAAARGRTPDQGGLNIEGLAWDPERQRLLLGLRGPLWNGQPVVVPFRLTVAGQGIDLEWDGAPLPIPGVEGVGIRALQYDPQLRALLLLTGGVERNVRSATSGNRFTLWSWAGTADQPAARLAAFPETIGGTKIKPEGVCRVTLPNGGSYFLVVSDDAPYYWKLRGRT